MQNKTNLYRNILKEDFKFYVFFSVLILAWIYISRQGKCVLHNLQISYLNKDNTGKTTM